MRKKFAIVVVIVVVSCSAMLGKEKPTITIQVVDSNTWQRQFDIHHNGTASQTNCDTNANTNGTVNDSSVYTTTNATTNCTTTPGSPAYTTHGSIAQDTTHAIMPDGTRVLLWCQAGFRKCSTLAPGTYQAEADGDNALRVYVFSLVTHKPKGKIKYHVTGTW
jgi:hypothetical protein